MTETRMIRRILGCGLGVFVMAMALLPVPAEAIVYGLKSHPDPDSAGASSFAPTRLFSFGETAFSVTDIAAVKVGGVDIDADALAISVTYGLLGYRIATDTSGVVTGSTLISINKTTGVATDVGSGTALARDIRGATFDLSGNLWVLDTANDKILKVDPTTGLEIGAAVTLSVGVSDMADIAVRANGTFYLVDRNLIYTLDSSTGTLTLVNTDGAPGDSDLAGPLLLAGAAFSWAAGDTAKLFAYDIRTEDDIFNYGVATGFGRFEQINDLILSFSAGRGDLAALPTPEPTSLLLFGTTLAGLGIAVRRIRARLR